MISEFRANSGEAGGPLSGTDLLLLTTVGAVSAEEHTVPLGYVSDNQGVVVVASSGGSDHHPDWYRNLLAHPMVTVETGTEEYAAVAVPAVGEERDRLFRYVVQHQPGYAEYQSRTSRTIPVVRLERSFGDDSSSSATVADKLVEVHTWLRGQLDRVRVEAEAYFTRRSEPGEAESAPVSGVEIQIRQHCLAFCEALHSHHSGEDSRMIPDLRRMHPHLGETLDRLQEEHRSVAHIQRELERLLADITTVAPETFRAELGRMDTELRAHLRYEETSLLPALAEIPLPSGPVAGGGEAP
ncbi:nitroreductase/quinone reductase family protein [Haloactinospora alba]|uniref:nitroreductase/quinone reductase family protein n=1 Tax=Haloactinospora alba TaxID=405555 RepID=UPI001FE53257|nr:nitroreductase/quinone reductase family protein [Haloactinospora alba]